MSFTVRVYLPFSTLLVVGVSSVSGVIILASKQSRVRDSTVAGVSPCVSNLPGPGRVSRSKLSLLGCTWLGVVLLVAERSRVRDSVCWGVRGSVHLRSIIVVSRSLVKETTNCTTELSALISCNVIMSCLTLTYVTNY